MNFCIYCSIECESDNPIHLIDCPFTTNLWPVLEQDLICELGCIKCGYDFTKEDVYTVSIPAAEILCISCALDDWIK